MNILAPLELWICLATIGCVLGTVSSLSIQTGPWANNAITAIRVAHFELYWAKIAFRDPAVNEAEFHLNEAWSRLRDRRYEQAFIAANQALQRVRGVPSLYSSQGDPNRGDPETRWNGNAVIKM